ncbi:MAG TPA: hypothetical protein VHW66_22410 [Stellaceae bacterium]|nr:hypothetical protein [Stellaceae bacterium]
MLFDQMIVFHDDQRQHRKAAETRENDLLHLGMRRRGRESDRRGKGQGACKHLVFLRVFDPRSVGRPGARQQAQEEIGWRHLKQRAQLLDLTGLDADLASFETIEPRNAESQRFGGSLARDFQLASFYPQSRGDVLVDCIRRRLLPGALYWNPQIVTIA